ncbi:MAG: patatin-like phospholipase family protein [Flavobacteriales bacterium]|nr:patatin-like phospholipase family protein [Flavobacteriales bacterium]
MEPSNEENVFKIGLCLAGAISAGAYTAGVIDYLIETLERWEIEKKQNLDIPNHKVVIEVIGGASAGGMTGIITAAALQEKFNSITQIGENLTQKQEHNKLYNTWVDLVADDMMNVILDTNDINSKVESLLNSSFIDKLADKAVQINTEKPIDRPYISDNLKIFVTLSNLTGFKYSAEFSEKVSSSNKYLITAHNDYACFQLSKNSETKTLPGWMPLNFKENINTTIAKNAAMATGAFPLGFKARKLSRDLKYLTENPWLKELISNSITELKNPHITLNVDGGMINNEPFEFVANALFINQNSEEKKLFDSTDYLNKEDFQKDDRFTSSILLIDPFPSVATETKNSSELSKVIENLLGTLLDQARVKPIEVVKALNEDSYGQFIISPTRYKTVDGKEISINGSKAIACGSVGGFGGFISKEFRIHDYFLGRANCERFLRYYFTVPSDTKNDIFLKGYKNVTDKKRFTVNENELQIIPIFQDENQNGIYMPKFSNGKKWPTVQEHTVLKLKSLVEKRVQKVMLNAVPLKWYERLLLSIGIEVLLKRKISKSIIKSLIELLSKHQLLATQKAKN